MGIAGIAGTAHAGSAVKAIDFQTGIIGQHPAFGEILLVFQPIDQRERFLHGIAGEGGGGFLNFGGIGVILERAALKAIAQQHLNFLRLVGIATGDDNQFGH